MPLDCIACNIKLALTSVRTLTDDLDTIEKKLKETLEISRDFQKHDNIFSLHYDIHKNIKVVNPDKDPFKEFKKDFNKICMDIAGELKEKALSSGDPFEMALRLALAGNSIDVMQGIPITKNLLIDAVDKSFVQPLDSEIVEKLRNNIVNAKKVLFIGDNAGEIVFDKLFLEIIKEKLLFGDLSKITYAVRGSFVINDSTREDAEDVGIDKLVKVITTGVDVPGAYLPYCSKSFVEEYNSSDLVISKGMGNCEALMFEKKNIFFLFKIKCQPFLDFFVSEHKLGELVIKKMD